MKRKSRKMAALLTATLLISAFTGCQSDGGQQDEKSPATTNDGAAVTTETNGSEANGTEKAGGDVVWWTWSTEAADAFDQQAKYIDQI